MTKRLLAIIVLSLLIVAFLAASVYAAKSKPNVWKYRIYKDKRTVLKMAGAEGVPFGADATNAPASLGFDEKASLSPGITIGTSTYDIQSNVRMNRQVEWRDNQMVHFIWTKSITDYAATRVTGYEVWEPDDAQLVFVGTGGGCDVHGDGARSGYVSLDIDTENKANIGNHYDPTGTGEAYMTTVFYDNLSASCFYGPYARSIPDSVAKMAFSESEITPGDWRLTWPQHEYQVLDGDTITHLITHQSYADAAAHIGDPAKMIYFRRVGSDTVGYWEYPPMIVDTITNISNSVAASRTSGKVDIVWSAPPGAYPGDPESNARNGNLDDGLGSVQRTCDIFYMESNNMGAPGSWGNKVNVTKYDSSVGGWLTTGDISPLIDPSDVLHVIWNAREAQPDPNGTALGVWTLYFGSRIFHWDEASDEVRVVTDRNWDITREEFNDSTCTGGAWNQMSCVKPMLSYCDGKFYVVFVQFLDLFHGVHDDCALLRWQGGGWSGAANGELYLSVSDNNGRNWDLPRNLTTSYTPMCDTAAAALECDADHWPAIPRFGME
ncbi:MAG: hypothetical protein JSU69_07790, partial [Candidatus Zixiibacteriota bacterium]